MSALDWLVIAAYGLGMAALGVWAYWRVGNVSDFFAGGGKLPWWLAGISHHMSGYSSAIFVAHAGVAYTYGFTLYVWYALPISIAILVGAFTVVPRWPRLRMRLGISSPLEYLRIRFNVPTQQLLAWSGVALKTFDMGAKWTAIAILLNVFAGVPIVPGVLGSVAVSMFYITMGGLWAAAATELVQFVIQFVAGVAMLVAVLSNLGGIGALSNIWQRLPPDHAALFNGQFTPALALGYLLASFLSYNGGTWNLAQRFIASPDGKQARRAAYLSSALYLLWPLVLFFPMWAAPLLLPDLADPTQCYPMLVKMLLPHGLIGLVLASLFAHTMAMTTSDANTVAAVISRDILPSLSARFRHQTPAHALRTARLATIAFTLATVVVALNSERMGGVLSLIVLWFGALIGPIATPMIFGLMSPFRRAGSNAAIASWTGGVVTYALIRFVFHAGMSITVGTPALVSAVIFMLAGWLQKEPPTRQVEILLKSLDGDYELATDAVPAD